MENEEILPTKKPDVDNVAKCVLDALNGIAYEDDAQVCELTIRKYYSTIPKTRVYIKTIDYLSNNKDL